MKIELDTVLCILTNIFLLWSKVVHSLEYENNSFIPEFDARHEYTNKWVVHIKDGESKARSIAEKHGFVFHGQLGSLKDYFYLEHEGVSKRSRRSADEHHTVLSSYSEILWFEQQKIKKRVKRGYFSDPLYSRQWYIKNDGQVGDRCNIKLDLNVVPAWKRNITGKGVVVTILDDGIEYTHPDLKKNYDPYASYDFNSNDNDPMPRYDGYGTNNHGTRCAGEVSSEASNSHCGVGVAYNAKIGGIRMLDGVVTDSIEAQSLSHNLHYVDIYSSSWGPDDNGATLEGPGFLTSIALQKGIKNGRKGLGTIYVWASGNGGKYGDDCSCDGYTNSPYTISIGAVDNCGRKPWYAEECPSTLAVGFSSGDTSDKKVLTTDLKGGCTDSFTGTSAAAPLAAGIFALVLEANSKLTWRDMQHLIVKTSKIVSFNDPLWQRNGAGHQVNPKFGFGALDAGQLVHEASSESWKTALPQRICETHLLDLKLPLRNGGTTSSILTTDGCQNLHNYVSRLEHVVLIVTINKRGNRGGLEINLISPSGTNSAILKPRARDKSGYGFWRWEFLTVFHWDENPKGNWTLKVKDSDTYVEGVLVSWKLKFYGTRERVTNEEEICKESCKRGCPVVFSDVCYGCSQYCDCTVGKCVHDCGDLETDKNASHCLSSSSRPLFLISFSGHVSMLILAIVAILSVT